MKLADNLSPSNFSFLFFRKPVPFIVSRQVIKGGDQGKLSGTVKEKRTALPSNALSKGPSISTIHSSKLVETIRNVGKEV